MAKKKKLRSSTRRATKKTASDRVLVRVKPVTVSTQIKCGQWKEGLFLAIQLGKREFTGLGITDPRVATALASHFLDLADTLQKMKATPVQPVLPQANPVPQLKEDPQPEATGHQLCGTAAVEPPPVESHEEAAPALQEAPRPKYESESGSESLL